MMQSKQCDSASFRRTVYFLNDLVKTVKEHIRSYLPDILRSMEPFWDTNQFEILIFIRVCSSCFHSEFKLYLVYVMPRMLSILSESAPEKRRAATEIVHCLHCIVPSLDNYLNVVFPGLMRFIENNEHVEASEREGVKCLKRIVNELDVSLYTSQIIMPLLRVLSIRDQQGGFGEEHQLSGLPEDLEHSLPRRRAGSPRLQLRPEGRFGGASGGAGGSSPPQR